MVVEGGERGQNTEVKYRRNLSQPEYRQLGRINHVFQKMRHKVKSGKCYRGIDLRYMQNYANLEGPRQAGLEISMGLSISSFFSAAPEQGYPGPTPDLEFSPILRHQVEKVDLPKPLGQAGSPGSKTCRGRKGRCLETG